MKKIVIYTTMGVALIVLGVYSVSSIYAEDNGGGQFHMPFITKLAEKLNMDEAELEKVVEEVREAERAEMDAERSEKILQAMEDGKISERQAEILNAMEDLRPEKGGPNGGMMELLKESVLDVTDEEIDELRDLCKELDIRFFGRGRGRMM